MVGRLFTRDHPHRWWVTDITEHRTNEGKVYCTVVLDTSSRRAVGWSIDSSQTAASAGERTVDGDLEPGGTTRQEEVANTDRAGERDLRLPRDISQSPTASLRARHTHSDNFEVLHQSIPPVA
ncbi:hypothetical protein EEB14_03910 [Rhodococcus sp. WS4]|nr:hypothetical protein EEB14_03910 [Rhodococcus sp. WS4]